MFDLEFLKKEISLGKPLNQIAEENNYVYVTLCKFTKKNGINVNNRGKFTLKDLTGQKFNKLLVIERVPNPLGKTAVYWKCQCDCGAVKIIKSGHIKDGTTKSCGCHLKEINYKGHKGLSGSFWCSIRTGARIRNLEFTLTIEEAWCLFKEQGEKCALTGLPLKLRNWNSKKEDCTASLDRIDSSKGYILGNVQWIHKDLQCMKWDTSQDKFKEYCLLIVLHNPDLYSKIIDIIGEKSDYCPGRN